MPYYKGSWYSQLPAFGWFDAQDRPGSAAYQVGGRSIPDSQQGIALPSRSGLGKWFNVTPPGGNLPFPMQQTDVGPAPWTGRGVDISAAAAHHMGYTPKNFPTDAAWKIEPRDEPRGLGSPAGMPVQAGDIPDNTTDDAYASGPSGSSGRQQQGPKMPAASLMDMLSGKAPLEFTPRDYAGNQIGIGDAIAQNSNSLVGLGMGLLQPTRPGESAYGNALQGYQTGSVADATRGYRTALLAHQKTQEARQAEQDKLAQSNWERQFTRNDPANLPTEFTRAARDLNLTPGTPEHAQFAKQFYSSKTEGNLAAQAEQRAAIAKSQGMDVNDPQIKGWIATGNVGGMQPKLSGGEESAIVKADDAVAANKAVMGSIDRAMQLSKKAASGPLALQRGYYGQFLPGQFSSGAKETLQLHNEVTSNMLEQLKTVFGGNPTEGERKVLNDVQGSVDQSDEVRQAIFQRAKEAANERMALNARRAQQMRAGTYYKPGGGGSAPPSTAPAASSDPLGIR